MKADCVEEKKCIEPRKRRNITSFIVSILDCKPSIQPLRLFEVIDECIQPRPSQSRIVMRLQGSRLEAQCRDGGRRDARHNDKASATVASQLTGAHTKVSFMCGESGEMSCSGRVTV